MIITNITLYISIRQQLQYRLHSKKGRKKVSVGLLSASVHYLVVIDPS